MQFDRLTELNEILRTLQCDDANFCRDITGVCLAMIWTIDNFMSVKNRDKRVHRKAQMLYFVCSLLFGCNAQLLNKNDSNKIFLKLQRFLLKLQQNVMSTPVLI